TLRRAGYDGPIRMVCAERHAPYDRPPLSKELLASSSEQPAPSFRAPEWYTEQSIDLLLGVSATCLDLAQKRVDLSDGTSLPFGPASACPGAAARDSCQCWRATATYSRFGRSMTRGRSARR